MSRIDGIREKSWSIICYSALIFYSILLLLFFREGMPPSDQSMAVFGVAFILIIAIALIKKKYSLMILTLLASAFSIYIYTYSLQYPTNDPIDIYSGFDLRTSDTVEFHSSESKLIFDNKKTVLKDHLSFWISKNVNETSTLSLSPPRSTEFYEIKVTSPEDGMNYATTPQFAPHLLSINGSVENNTFPELERLEVPLNWSGRYDIITEYELPKKDPYFVRLHLWGGKNGAQINLNHVHSAIYFSDMLYECIDPCIVVHSANITTTSPYAQRTNMLDEGTYEKPFRSYYVEGDNVGAIHYHIRTSSKWAVVVRNLMLSIIAGLIVALVTTWRS